MSKRVGRERGRWRGVTWAFLMLACSATAVGQEGATETDLKALCVFGPPASGDEEMGRTEYHRHRRELVYQVHETQLREVDPALMDYDHVTGLLTISGFREYRLPDAEMTLAFQNGCTLQFEYDEARAHDIMAQIAMGTIRLEMGFLLGAVERFETDYCPQRDDGGRQLDVELLFARLIEIDARKEEQVVGWYQTPEGLRWDLRSSTLIAEEARQAVPEVEISDFRWMPYEVHQEIDQRQGGLRERIQEELEEGLFPCYSDTLRRNPSTQGALVVETGFGASLTVLLDTIDEALLEECVRQEMASIVESHREEALEMGADRFKVTVLMRRR